MLLLILNIRQNFKKNGKHKVRKQTLQLKIHKPIAFLGLNIDYKNSSLYLRV